MIPKTVFNEKYKFQILSFVIINSVHLSPLSIASTDPSKIYEYCDWDGHKDTFDLLTDNEQSSEEIFCGNEVENQETLYPVEPEMDITRFCFTITHNHEKDKHDHGFPDETSYL
ncbi:hypothetical protein RCL_jg9682.t1 [Rhizophagus clarus]|uniref:Uncharacterized protein n=1 Tax=Rhizophagus clarus TaxID=94130 RepID=A0A8H3LZX3_9GLOM|nr:hypothetical protein RCL_jg9682.t1 [Rhizophagus clarus]